MIFRNSITLHCYMKGSYSTQFHTSHKECPQLPHCTVFQLGLRDLSQAQERDNPDWTALEWPLTQSSLNIWFHLSPWSTMVVSSLSIRPSINFIIPRDWWFWGSCGSTRALHPLPLFHVTTGHNTEVGWWGVAHFQTNMPGGKPWSTGLFALEPWRHW